MSLSSISSILFQLLKEKVNSKYKARRSNLQNILGFDLFLREFDSFISSFEIHNDSDPEIGAIVASTSYSFPLKNGKRFITSYAYGEREYVEYTDSLRDISFKTHHILGQFEKTI